MTRGRRSAKGEGIVRWLLPASVLHAAFVLGGALSPWMRAPERATTPFGSTEPESSIELTLSTTATG